MNGRRAYLLFRSVTAESELLVRSKEISEKLLLNVLPPSVVDRVKQGCVYYAFITHCAREAPTGACRS